MKLADATAHALLDHIFSGPDYLPPPDPPEPLERMTAYDLIWDGTFLGHASGPTIVLYSPLFGRHGQLHVGLTLPI